MGQHATAKGISTGVFMNRESNSTALAKSVAFLSDPRNYPDSPQAVEVIETHWSWVFMTETDVYKLKKPVRTQFVDFSTVEARHSNCNTEVKLNQRLAAGIYLGAEPLVRDEEGCMHIGGVGEPVDWLVHMRRLPSNRMLEQLIRERKVELSEVRQAALLLADFYRKATSVEISAKQYQQRLLRYINENYEELANPAYGLPVDQVQRISNAQRQFLTTNPDLFKQRASHVIEAHGDLRPEHICLADTPVIIDCLEFKSEFRLLDPVDELAFLRMECDMAGAGFVGDLFLAVYNEQVDDCPPKQLVAFYQCYRACLWAKLAVWHLDDGPHRNGKNWLKIAAQYLDRSEQYAKEFSSGEAC